VTGIRALLVGYGRMGRMIDALAPEYGIEVIGRLTSREMADPSGWAAADVAIDFSAAHAVTSNARMLAGRGLSLVIGTTGWSAEADALRRDLEPLPIGVIAAPNFAIGVNLFLLIAGRSAALLAGHNFEVWIHESHHAAKKDAPSGTALALQDAMAPHAGTIHIASTRAGFIPGTHTAGFDSPAETITLTHTARDRTAFARGALEAARWIHGRRGWFTMSDMLGGN
jgi:4-hydroxy-tetrahydrodipicolinate reductase